MEKKMRTGNVRKYVKSMLTKYLGAFIILIGVLVYNLGSIIVWYGLAIAGLLLFALGFYVGIGQLLSIEFNPKMATVLNFFLPGLGFMYCREWYFVLGGGALFIATLHPRFPCYTILSIIALAITNPSILTLQQIISATSFTSAVLILTYFSVKVHERGERNRQSGGVEMKKVFTVTLILMVILTVIYVSVVYANTNANAYPHRYVLYAADEYKSETPPTDWYTPEQLGIYDVIEYGENGSWLHIAVDLEKEPFPLQSKNPIFLYKDKFYQVSPLWTTPGLPEHLKQWQIPIGGALGVGWVLTGVLFLKWRKKARALEHS